MNFIYPSVISKIPLLRKLVQERETTVKIEMQVIKMDTKMH